MEQMYYGNQQFLFVYEQFDDVRLVAAPPSSIGKFGGDTDNWIWPRHTGDFSMFRVYASKENKPAPYSPQNVPYRPKKHFTISTKGVKEGDFTMIYGFPGNTQEYILSDAVAYIAERSDPAKIAVRTGRLDIISKAQESDPALRILYAASHASIANAWKKWQGEVLGIERRGTVAAKTRLRGGVRRLGAGQTRIPRRRRRSSKPSTPAIADPYFAREITRETLGDAARSAYSAKERAEAVFARREATERRPVRMLQFGEYARRCPAAVSDSGIRSTAWPAAARPKPLPSEVFDAGLERGATPRRQPRAAFEEPKRMLDHIAWLTGTKSLRNLNSKRPQRTLHLLY